MREMASSGDLSRRIPVPEGGWQDRTRVLATTFNTMTDSIARFQRDAAQRERLSSLGRLSTIVAHEIRNPLMIIKTSLRSLRREDADPEQVRGAAKDIDEEITRLNRIVTEVLDFARPIRFDLDTADVNAPVDDAIKAAAASSPDVPVRVDLDGSLPSVTTDAGRLRQALVNVIGNAIQAVGGRPADGGAPIRVQTSRLDARRFLILIADKGAGIPTEDLPRIFDPFFTTRRTGTGIGLAISRNIIEGLGGRISVSSARDRGTDVRIELLIREPHDQNNLHDTARRRRGRRSATRSAQACARGPEVVAVGNHARRSGSSRAAASASCSSNLMPGSPGST
jgi:signal transduction histidine kinase